MHRVDTRLSAVIVAMALGGGFARAQQPPAAPNATAAAAIPAAVQAHIDHVMTGWKDTPGGIGLLPAAIADAKIAEEHAHNTDLEGRVNDFILYSGYVLNELNPGAETQALLKTAYARLVVTDPKLKDTIPGSGYGVKKAVAGALQHVQFAAKSEDASENVKTHAVHVSASLENVGQWA